MKIKYIKRDIEKTVKHYADILPAIAVLGARQTGKTTMLQNIFEKSYKYVSLDDLDRREYAETDPKGFLEDLGSRVIIDEIQYVPKLFSYVKMKIDAEPELMGRYIFTGSQNFLIMKEFTETLAGRIGVINMHPLACTEIPLASAKPQALFEQGSVRGGYPVLWKNRTLTPEEWYKSYIKIYIERDVRNLFNIGNLRSFHTFVRILAGRAGQILNMSALAADSSVTVNTIKSWLSILESSGIIYLLYPYHKNIRSKLVKSPKVYFLDTGLICYFNGIDSAERMSKTGQKGALFENYCVSEVKKAADNRGADIELSFFRNHTGLEVDLILENRKATFAAEIKAGLSTGSGAAAGIIRMEKEYPALKVDAGYVLTYNPESSAIAKNIVSISFLDFIKKVL